VFPDKPVTRSLPRLEWVKARAGGTLGGKPTCFTGARPLRNGGRPKEDIAREALRLAAHKLPLKTRFLRGVSEMKMTELREKSVDELNALDAEFRALFDLRFKHYTGQLVDTASAQRAGISLGSRPSSASVSSPRAGKRLRRRYLMMSTEIESEATARPASAYRGKQQDGQNGCGADRHGRHASGLHKYVRQPREVQGSR
jgi:hypothetical protein